MIDKENGSDNSESQSDSLEGLDQEDIFTKDSRKAGKVESKQEVSRHSQLRNWTDVIFDIGKKTSALLVFGTILADVWFPDSSELLETIFKLFKLSLENGKIEITASAIALYVLARNLPVFIKQLKKMLDD